MADDYVHRVGRTARAGRSGTAVTFVTEGDVDLVGVLEERISTSFSPLFLHRSLMLFSTDTKLEELDLPEGPVLELLNAVSIAKRMANMALHAQGFGKKQERNKMKNNEKLTGTAEVKQGKKVKSRTTVKVRNEGKGKKAGV